MDIVGNVILWLWIGTEVFVMIVAMVVELMVLQFLKVKWTRYLPVAVGMVLTIPVALLYRSLYLGAVSMFWYILASGLAFSYLGIRLAKRISKKIE